MSNSVIGGRFDMKEKNALYCSFSLRGLIAFLMVLLPNAFFFALSNSISQNNLKDKNTVTSFLQAFFQLVLIFMLVFVKSTKKNSIKDIRFAGAIVFLILYYILWLRYFAGGMDYSVISESLRVALAMAAFPSIYLILTELWLNNKIGALAALCFGIAHIVNTYLNFK
jgi:hypothetical protein